MIGDIVTPTVRASIRGIYVALATFLTLVTFAGFVVYASDAQRQQAQVEPLLATWSNERILAELGEAAQVGDCDGIAGGPGLTARFYVSEQDRRLIVVCTPTR